MKSVASIFAAPVLCLAVLGGIVLDGTRHTRPEDAEPYHRAARAVIDAWPAKPGESWASSDVVVPAAAVNLLRPNTILSRRYVDLINNRHASLLIVQCRSPEDMSGHYPPNCYRQSGQGISNSEARTWQVGDVEIHGMEYHFESATLGQSDRTCVYNFFVLPGRGIRPDMNAVYEATGDYQRRWYGAAQFQMVFDQDMPQQARDEMFLAVLTGPHGPGERPHGEVAIRTLENFPG